jgi:hypothetical protein
MFSKNLFKKYFIKVPQKNHHKGLIYYPFMTTPIKWDYNEDYQQKPYSIQNILLNYHYLTHFYISILLISCREPTVPLRPLHYPFFRITNNNREGS